MVIIVSAFSMFYQILISPQVERSMTISNEHGNIRVASWLGEQLMT